MVQFSLPFFLVASTIGLAKVFGEVSVALAQQPLYLAYPPDNHETTNVQLGTQTLNLQEQQQITTLPANAAVLLKDNAPQQQPGTGQYQGCSQFAQPLTLHPQFDLQAPGGQTLHQPGTGTIEILDPRQITIAAVTVPSGTARTGPSTDYSRLTPLPQGLGAIPNSEPSTPNPLCSP